MEEAGLRAEGVAGGGGPTTDALLCGASRPELRSEAMCSAANERVIGNVCIHSNVQRALFVLKRHVGNLLLSQEALAILGSC